MCDTPTHLWLLETALKSHGRNSETNLRVMGRTWDQQKELTHFGESALGLTPGKTALVSLLRAGWSLGSNQDALKRNKLDAKNLRQDFFALALSIKTGFGLLFTLPWPNECLAFDIAAEGTRISGSEASTQAVHFTSLSQRRQIGPKCTLPSLHVKTSPVGQQDLLLLLLDASFQRGVVAGVGWVADHRGVPGNEQDSTWRTC